MCTKMDCSEEFYPRRQWAPRWRSRTLPAPQETPPCPSLSTDPSRPTPRSANTILTSIAILLLTFSLISRTACTLLPGFFHSPYCVGELSTLQCISAVLSFSLLWSILLYKYTTIYFPFYSWWTFVLFPSWCYYEWSCYELPRPWFFDRRKHSLLLGICLGVWNCWVIGQAFV